MDTLEAIEKDFNDCFMVEDSAPEFNNFTWLQLRILIQIAYQLRTLAQKGE